MNTTTKITRSASATLGYLGAGIVAIALSVWLCRVMASGLITTGLALIPGVVGLLLIYMAFAGSGVSTCPGCGAPLSGLSTGTNEGVICANCHSYVEGTEGTLTKTDEGKIAETPIFTTTVPPSFSFPPGCCVCGAPEVRREKISLKTQNASSALTESTIGVTSSTTTSVEVPHCAVHSMGASLSGTPSRPKIRFRSYPYLRAFCALNGTKPE